jgi:hypothetical protein
MKMEQIVRIETLGKGPEEIAAIMGMGIHNLRELLRHPEYADVQRAYANHVYAPVDAIVLRRTATQLLEEAAPDAAQALVDLLRADDDPIQKRLSAEAILDRSGHGPVQRRAVRTRVELDPATAALFQSALRESKVMPALPAVGETDAVAE